MVRKAIFTTVMLILIASFSWSNFSVQAAFQIQDISINYGETKEVVADQVVHLPGPVEMPNGTSGQNGYGYVTMPSDLPEGSELTVSALDDIEFATDTNGEQIALCGEAYSFAVETPDETSYSDSFSIALPYCNGLSDLDIYISDETTDYWTKQNGEHNQDFLDYTAKVAQLNKVGIFSAEQIGESGEESADETDTNEEAEIVILLNEETPVSAGQKVIIGETGSWIIMPADLPEGTLIKVEDVTDDEFVTNANGLEVSGDVFTITLALADPSFDDVFTLVLATDDGEGDIYYYNEDTKTWEKQGAESNEDKTNFTVETDHFSTYGVFTEATDNSEEEPLEETSNNDYACYEDPAEMYITINFNEEVNVCPEQQITIEDTLNYLVMPTDLPQNATLTVIDVGESDIVTDAKGLHRAGDVLQFTLKIPEDSSFTEKISLKMPYANGVSADDIYYYNESTKEWEEQGAEFDYEDFTLNVELSHLSTYGVFGSVEDENLDDEANLPTVTVDDGDDDRKSNSILPKTATSLFNWLLLGTALIVTGFILFMIKRRKSSRHG